MDEDELIKIGLPDSSVLQRFLKFIEAQGSWQAELAEAPEL